MRFVLLRPGLMRGLALCLLLLASGAHAQTRAWLDRDRIGSGDTATLNIETDQLAVEPDYSPLMQDFALSGRTSRRSVEIANGTRKTRTLFAVGLQPRRDGVIGIPGLRVGNAYTQPLMLTVAPTAATPARVGDSVCIESEADTASPFVQQSVGFVVRLYSAEPLLSGQLDQDAPEGASLQRIGDDVRTSRELDGRRYSVIERRYLLVPERSGSLAIPGARFQGHSAGSFFDDLLGDGRRALHANAAPQTLQVRAAPAHAPQPWLPLRDLRLRYLATPQQVRAGEATTVVVEAVADGASAAQLPELQLPAGDGVQVFAEPAQADERFVAGRPQVTLTRRFSLVPARAGTLRLPGPRLAWWDVQAGAARTARLPDLTLPVAPGTALGDPAGNSASNPTSAALDATGTRTAAADAGRIRVPGIQGALQPWAVIAAVFALLWLATLIWGLQRQPEASVAAPAGGAPAKPNHAGELKRALDTGTLAEVGQALCALATPPAVDLDAVHARLADPAQVAALEALQRARWGDGDATAARTALRSAFQRGPRWRAPQAAATGPLPPLYPPG